MTETAKATLKDVAALAGVSIKTASRVLNDHPNVAPSTKDVVLSVMRELDYIPDPAARSLRAGVDRCVGVLVDSIGDVFFAELAAAIEAELDKHHYRSLIVSSNRDTTRELETVNMFIRRRCAGMIIAPLSRDSIASLNLRNASVVFVDRVGNKPGAHSVVVDDFQLSQKATEHLISHGHTRIAIISDHPTLETTRNRHLGYRAGMREHGIQVDENLVCLDASGPADAFSILERLLSLDAPPTAIFCTNSRLSLGLLPALHSYGRTDLALIAFGDFVMAGSLSPAVTVIEQSPLTIGKTAVDALLRQLKSDTPDEPTESVTYVESRLIPRGSGELRPRTDISY